MHLQTILHRCFRYSTNVQYVLFLKIYLTVINLKKYLFLLAESGVSCDMQSLSCSMWDRVP